MPTAAGLADAIKKKFNIEPELIEGSGGVFDVHANGTELWSKRDAGRFPEHREILEKLDAFAAKK